MMIRAVWMKNETIRVRLASALKRWVMFEKRNEPMKKKRIEINDLSQP